MHVMFDDVGMKSTIEGIITNSCLNAMLVYISFIVRQFGLQRSSKPPIPISLLASIPISDRHNIFECLSSFSQYRQTWLTCLVGLVTTTARLQWCRLTRPASDLTAGRPGTAAASGTETSTPPPPTRRSSSRPSP